MNGQPRYVLREMQFADIPQVVAIDRQAFPIPWSSSVYRYEIGQNPISTMVVVSLYEAPSHDENHDGSPIDRIMGLLRGRQATMWHRAVVGYGGFWFSQGEAHVSTIASHPEFRRLGLGELLLAGMIRRALQMDPREVSLEVRISNATAIALYSKYGFKPAGIKARYYRDNHEDAYDMRVPVDDAFRAMVAGYWTTLMRRVAVQDDFTALRRGRHRN